MRTTLLLGILLATTLATPALGEPLPASPEVDRALEELGIDLRILDKGADQASDEGRGSDAGAQKVTAAAVIVGPVESLSRSLVELGLSLISGFFTGVSNGASTFVHAAAITAAAPAESLSIAAATLAVAGLASLVGLAIQRYGGLGAIPLFSRIAKSEIFENKVRADVFDLIRENPGINVSEISRRLDVAWGTATHHLQKLRLERMVSIRLVGHQKCYFPNGGAFTPREMEVMGATKNGTAKRIAEFIAQSGPTAHRDVSLSLGLSPALVSFHTRKLEAAGVVERRREGRNTVFVALESNLSPSARPSVHSL